MLWGGVCCPVDAFVAEFRLFAAGAVQAQSDGWGMSVVAAG
jgi:hypothetical protein